MNKNVIAFQKGLMVIPSAGIDNRNLAMITQAELMRFGYMLDQDALNQLGYADAADIKDFHNQVIDYLKDMTGGTRTYEPIYKGFPTQVMEMSEFELWRNQLIGYWSGGSFTANDWTKTKGTAFEQVKYRMIAPGTSDKFDKIFTTLATAGQSLTPTDVLVLEWFIANQPFLTFPEVVPFKENLCSMIGKLITSNRGIGTVQLPKLTTTDVLRIAVYLSGGDISLPAVPPATISVGRWSRSIQANPAREAFEFKKFSRKERRFILALLENSNLDVRDMKLKDQRWVKLGEILHPGEYSNQFPKTYKAFDRIRNEKVVSWYGEVTKAFAQSFKDGLTKLSERPGEFLRRLDYLIRTFKAPTNVQQVLDVLSRIGVKSSNKVLFEVYDHFEKRTDPVLNRSIMIKGARKRQDLPDLPAISKDAVEAVQSTIFSILKEKFALLPTLGDCWIDEELKKIPLPTNMRSLNDTLVPTIRGQRVPFGTDKKVIRPFIHWFDPQGRIDLDLHGFLFGNKQSVTFGYNGIHSSQLGCYSGDVRHRQGACAEYVDINVAAALAQGFDYFLMVVHNFTGGPLSNIKDCVAGVMEREYPESNYTWKPDTIANAMKLTNSSEYALIGAYDLRTREYIHLDLDYGQFTQYVHSGQANSLFAALAPYIAAPKVSVYDLLKWHVEARGRNVSKETATTHFLYDDFVSSYEKTIELMGV